MASNPTQLSAATALVQLLTEHPRLSDHVTWSIPRTAPGLVGYVHGDGVAVLAYFRESVGGSVQVADPYRSGEAWVQQHVLSSVWRDVPVEVVVTLPVAAGQVAA